MLKRWLSKSKEAQTKLKPSLSLSPRPLTVAELTQLIPLRNFSEEELNTFSLTQQTETYGPGSILFEQGTSDPFLLYLLAGTVTLVLNDTQSYEVAAGTAKARFPLSYGASHSATAIAKTDVEVVRVPAQVMHKNLNAQLKEDRLLDPNLWEIPPELKNSRLFQAFCQNFQNEELKLPTLPNLALKLRQAIERDDLGAAEAARIVQMDAAIAAKLIHVANSPLYFAAHPAKNCLEAINRLGLKATCNLVVLLCLRDVFTSQDRFLYQKMHTVWQEAIHLSALAYVLAEANCWRDPDEALLGGLICNLGAIPFLTFAAGFPKTHYQAAEIDLGLPIVCAPGGYYLLKRWGFPEELVRLPMLATAWHYDSGPQLTLSDLIMLAKLHRYIETGRMAEVPAINSIPACRKLRDSRLSPEYSLQILHNAHLQIHATLTLLR